MSFYCCLSSKGNRKEGKKTARLARIEINDDTIIALEKDLGWDGASQSSEAQIIKETRTIIIKKRLAILVSERTHVVGLSRKPCQTSFFWWAGRFQIPNN